MPFHKIIRRRAVVVIGEWVLSLKDTREKLYGPLLHLLSTDDLVVKVSVSSTLQTMFNDIEFDSKVFEPFVQGVTTSIVGVIVAAEEVETKLQLLNVLTDMMRRVEGETIR
eukprot:CAMPEP_0113912134 /NCGR_PEP_ID=MMETSP0780_2-20120614/28716_1 /TAXON_ID=652834 /ORGANISM="Palpitomonas bilix" /LENGTH=110 /DNA_ID=CAMNT_0000908975 /DNA_START=7 /DNA_END=335 /DNA_ORIENTATION=+ /assembly_acc=CAM_ASM_000599